MSYNNLLFRTQKSFTISKYMQREKLTIKKEHSHLEIAKANRAKWLGQAEKILR